MGAQPDIRYYTLPEYGRMEAEAKREKLCQWMSAYDVSPARLRDFEALMMGGQVGDGLFLDPNDPLGDTGFAGVKSVRLGWRRVARAELVVKAFLADSTQDDAELLAGESSGLEFRKRRFKE